MRIFAGWTVLHIGFFLTGLAEAESLDWIKPYLPSLPSARSNVSMPYDTDTRTAVLFGGNINNGYTAYDDTWLFTRAFGWIQLYPSSSPSPRSGAGFAYDPTTKTDVLFGGTSGSNTFLNDTWTWDGVTWTQQFPPVSPPPHGFNSEQMAYDAATGTVVFFDGFSPGGGFWGDTWEWNGAAKTWTQSFPASSPSPRGTTLTYDKATRKIMIFGGGAGGPFFGDTWTWDGVTWTQQFPATSPSARASEALAYDATIGKVVLVGGYSAPGGVALDEHMDLERNYVEPNTDVDYSRRTVRF